MFSPEVFTILVDSYLHEPHASLLNGIVLGRKLFVTDIFYEQLKIVGLIHIVVLSGSNITMLSAIIMNLIVKHVGRQGATVVTIFTIVGFIFFVGVDPPIVRAGIMGILSLIGLLFGRRTLALYLLFVSSVIMILINNEWLTSISFQLSFGATLGIILFGNVARANTHTRVVIPAKAGIQNRKRWIPDHVRDDIWKYFSEELRISVAAQIFTVPIIFWYFRQISFISPLANILISWLIGPIMVLGMLTMLLGSINWHAGFALSWLCYGMISIIVWVTETLAQVPYASIKL